jgi:hypothetical protein
LISLTFLPPTAYGQWTKHVIDTNATGPGIVYVADIYGVDAIGSVNFDIENILDWEKGFKIISLNKLNEETLL